MAPRRPPAPRAPVDRADLVSPSARRRAGAVEAIGEEATPEQLGVLLSALDDPAACVRVRAVEGLEALARRHARPLGTVRRVLSKRLGTDDSARVKARIAAALEALDEPAPEQAQGDGARTPEAEPRRPKRPRKAAMRRAPLKGPEPPPIDDEAHDHDYDEGAYDDRYGELAWPFPADDGLTDTGPVEALVARWTARLFAGPSAEAKPRLEHLLPLAELERLRAMVKPSERAPLPAEIEAFSARTGQGFAPDEPASTLASLALRTLARLHGLPTPAPPAWGLLRPRLLERLRAAPPEGEGEREEVVLAFHAATVEGPDEVSRAIEEAEWHEGWLPLSPWLAATDDEEPSASERVRGSRGSLLAQRNVREALGLGRSRGPLAPWAPWQTRVDELARKLLGEGGGSLLTLDYPSFRVMGRAALIELSGEQEGQLGAVAAELGRVRAALDSPVTALASLLSWLSGGRLERLDEGARQALIEAVLRSALSYVGLRREGVEGRIRRSQLLSFARRPGLGPGPRALAEARAASPDRLLEGLVLGLLAELHQPHSDDAGKQHGAKELLIEASRVLAACYAWSPLPPLREGDVASAQALIDALIARFEHAPLELSQALGLDPRQGLPRLRGGQASSLEQRFSRLYREALRGRRVGEGQTYLCRPLSKRAALLRGELGRDCSSSSVPLRALSPHHVYYGLFDERGGQLPGYLTVYEAWARGDDGQIAPVLCLETVNEPRGLLSGVQQDLLVIFEAIAQSRGLAPGLVLITGHGTWNYANGGELARCRRARQGRPVRLSPADPVVHRLYERTCGEARYYSAFGASSSGELLTPSGDGEAPPMTLLAPFDPERDRVQPENLAEARRLALLPPRSLLITCRDERGAPVGFVSGRG